MRGSVAALCRSDCKPCGHRGKSVPVPLSSVVGPGTSKWWKCVFRPRSRPCRRTHPRGRRQTPRVPTCWPSPQKPPLLNEFGGGALSVGTAGRVPCAAGVPGSRRETGALRPHPHRCSHVRPGCVDSPTGHVSVPPCACAACVCVRSPVRVCERSPVRVSVCARHSIPSCAFNLHNVTRLFSLSDA